MLDAFYLIKYSEKIKKCIFNIILFFIPSANISNRLLFIFVLHFFY